MTKEQLAETLDGREYPFDLREEEKQAKADRLVVIYGVSDDLVEFAGAIDDEMGAPGEFRILNGEVLPEVTGDEWEAIEKHCLTEAMEERREKATLVEIKWHEQDGWEVTTTAPHAKFQIMEDGAVFCQAIVIDLKELP